MKKEKKYHGVVVPMVTPFTKNGSLDESAGVRILEHVLEGGAYPFLLGTTGESASIPFGTRIKFVRSVLKNRARNTYVYVGISDTCIENSIRLAETFIDLGVDVLVAHLPAYYPITADQMLSYYETLADRSPGPVMIYNVVLTTKMSVPLNIVEKLSHHPNIIGMKDSERDIDRMKASAELFANRKDFSILLGWSTQATNALLAGFDGIVPNPGNLIPEMYKKIYDAVIQGDKKTAYEMQEKTDVIANIFQKDKVLSQVFAGLKVMMHELSLCEPWVLPPLTLLSREESDRIKLKMKGLGLTK